MRAMVQMTMGWRLALVAVLGVGLGSPVLAWTPRSQDAIAREAARLAPPDLYRQIARNKQEYLLGVADGFKDREAANHVKNEDGGGRLDKMIRQSVDYAVRSIQLRHPFREICYRLGVVAHYVADASNPLNGSEKDPAEKRYYADYLFYLESAQSRFKVVFYGFRPEVRTQEDLPALIDEILRRGRRQYPLIGREYRRIDFKPGKQAFDDRSTAYGIGSLSFSHAVSNVAEFLRLIWLEAGGADRRRHLPNRGQSILPLSPSVR